MESNQPKPVPGTGMLEQRETAEEGSGLYCFMDQLRLCGPACMAYLNPAPQNDPELRGQQWAHCHLLVNVHRGGKHLVILTSMAHRALNQQPGANIPPPQPR